MKSQGPCVGYGATALVIIVRIGCAGAALCTIILSAIKVLQYDKSHAASA